MFKTNVSALPSLHISRAMDSDNRELLILRACRIGGACRAPVMRLRDRAPKHEHQAEAKKDFAVHFCFHV